MRRRNALPGLVLGLALLTGCGRMYLGSPLDPSASYVVPPSGVDAAVVQTSAAAGSHPPGVEGGVLFVRLANSRGQVVLDRPFEWPRDHQNVPPADYHLSAYWRGCNGSCADLSAEAAPFCVADLSAAPRTRIEIVITTSDLYPGDSCTVSVG